MKIKAFQKTVWDFYRKNKRELPWRKDTSPYSIVVSEIMLQQTQVKRVITKYESFMKRFPNWKSLAKASVSDVIGEWKGLGYNRRGLALQKIAQFVIQNKNKLPETPEELEQLPHIGPNTAGSIAAFAFNYSAPFIETNIRTVFIHHFFKDKENVSDKELLPLIEKSLDKKKARKWYWALMDYGSYLKQELGNFSRQSKHYKKQSRFKGSNRELRSKMLTFIHQKARTEDEMEKYFHESADTEVLMKNLKNMEQEGFLKRAKNMWKIA